MTAKLDAAPMEIKLFELNSDGTKGTEILTLSRLDQVEDSTRTIRQNFLELFSQESALPASRRSMGQTAEIAFSVADVYDERLFAYATNQAVRTDSTTDTKKLIIGLGVSGGTPLSVWVEARPYDGNAPSTDANKTFVIPNGQFIAEEIAITQGLQTQNQYQVVITSQAAAATVVVDGVQGGFHWFLGDQTVSSS